MKKHLIAIDLDGTLLNSKSLISAKTNSFLRKLQQEGHKIVIATGRPYRGSLGFYQELDLNTPLIVDNGASIFQENDSSFQPYLKRIDNSVLVEIFNYAKSNINTAFYSVLNELYAYQIQRRLDFYFHLNEQTKIIETPFLHHLPEAPLVMLAIKRPFDEHFEDYIATNFQTEISLRCWGKDKNNGVYELIPSGVSKGKAILKIAEHYNIALEEIISFGDGANDVELLSMSGHGVLMANGSDELKAVSDAITEYSNDEDGVIRYLETYFKNK
ncbi:MAG: HAD family phosphatase [Acholeplasmataceae bacterium]|nr:HAD family phosphatase [Acholeplasmataceae bacterium]